MAVPYATFAYPMVFLVLIRLWSVAHVNGFVTTADFVKARFDSKTLALLVAITGIAAMPYIALQLVGVQAISSTMGVKGSLPLVIAFIVLARYMHNSGLRALALMLYPHAATAILAAKSRNTIKRNMALLPAYSLMLGFLSLLGFMAVASGVIPIGANPKTGIGGDGNTIVPVLFDMHFNSWFAGIAFAAIAGGALVPAAVMSIAASNTFTRNIYNAYFKPNCSPKEKTLVAKIVSFVVKFGAVGFIVFLDRRLWLAVGEMGVRRQGDGVRRHRDADCRDRRSGGDDLDPARDEGPGRSRLDEALGLLRQE